MVQESALAALLSHGSIVSLVARLLVLNIHLHTASIIYNKPQGPTAVRPDRG